MGSIAAVQALRCVLELGMCRLINEHEDKN